jgi:hypothetical protein
MQRISNFLGFPVPVRDFFPNSGLFKDAAQSYV